MHVVRYALLSVRSVFKIIFYGYPQHLAGIIQYIEFDRYSIKLSFDQWKNVFSFSNEGSKDLLVARSKH